MWVLILTFYNHIIHFNHIDAIYQELTALKYQFPASSTWKPFIPADWHVLTSVFQSAGSVPHIFVAMWRFKNRLSQANTRTKGKRFERASNLVVRATYLSWSVVFKTSNCIKQCFLTYTLARLLIRCGMWTVVNKEFKPLFWKQMSLIWYKRQDIVWSAKQVTLNNLTYHISQELSTR